MRTLVISDLHLGSRTHVDVLATAVAREALVERARGAGRLVLLGDTFELRHGPVREALAAAEPLLRALAGALGPDAEVVLVPGNHDHRLLRPWQEDLALDGPPPALALDTEVPVEASPPLQRIAELLAPVRLAVRYPGVWLRDDVFATHGHYLDRLVTIPSFERLAAGAIERLYTGPLPSPATPDDFEVALAPMYGFMDAIADRARDGAGAAPARTSVKAWELLSRDNRRPLLGRAAGLTVPLAILGLNRAGIGPLHAEFSGAELRRAGVRAMRGVLGRLGITAPHVLFGHTHRSGPSKGDDLGEWGPLVNTGSWVHEPTFTRNGPSSPYWPGRAVELEDDGAPPRLIGLLDGVAPSALRQAG